MGNETSDRQDQKLADHCSWDIYALKRPWRHSLLYYAIFKFYRLIKRHTFKWLTTFRAEFWNTIRKIHDTTAFTAFHF